MSDRIVVMNAGRVEQDGTPEDLYFRPRSRFVAEFIGETNLIQGTVAGRDNGAIVIDWNGLQVRGAVGEGGAPAAGANVTAALRLESVLCHPQKPAGVNAIPGRVVHRLFKGSRTALDIRVGEGEDAVLKAYMDATEAQRIAHQDLWVSWDASRLSVLRD
jgi:spermidine/putrescine transport system ATP-binding protein